MPQSTNQASCVVTELIRGAWDIHVHPAPDTRPRFADALDLATSYRDAGLAGIVLKDHFGSTVDAAHLVSRVVNNFTVYGSVTLNRPVGGINPDAVYVALKHGARIVFMPTLITPRREGQSRGANSPINDPTGRELEDTLPFDQCGQPKAEVEEVFRLAAQANAVVGFGHLAPEQTELLLAVAKRLGVRKLLVNHASLYCVRMPPEIQRRMAAAGAFIEHSYLATRLEPHLRTEIGQIVNQIRAVGGEHCILSTDFGQSRLSSPVIGFVSMVEEFLAAGLTPMEIRLMIRDNPKRLLDD